jgi:tetratricopeptide (TPR) repeat protein
LEANPNADAVYCACRFVDEANNPLPQIMGRVVPPNELHNVLLNGGFFAPLCMFASKYCYEQLGYFDRSFQGCADLDMWLRISKYFTVIGTDAILARYRVAPQSMSSDPQYMLNDRIAVLQKHFGNGSSGITESSPARRLAYGRSYLTATSEYLQLHELEQAYRCLREAFNTSPELAGEFDVFYELGCGDQPRGYRGDFVTLNRQHNAQILSDLLGRLFDDPQVSPTVKGRRRLAYANAYLALGLLSYGARDFRGARRFLTRALASNPSLGLKAQVARTWLKSLLNARLIEEIKDWRYRMTSH